MAHHQGMSLLALAHALLDGPMQRRFLSDPLVRTTELLLQERVPKHTVIVHPRADEGAEAGRAAATEAGAVHRVLTDPNTPLPEVHLLSNGRYHVMATHAGGGYSRWRDLAVTRWREDATCDGYGTFIYLRDRETGSYWSTAYQPTRSKADRYEAVFVQARAEYRRVDHAIEAHTEISVSPEDDVEIRRVTLTNLSDDTREIEVTSYAEVVMAPLNADLAHRAFSNLFVQTEILPGHGAILCKRRPRDSGGADAVDVPSVGGAWRRQRRHLVRDRPRPVHRPGKNGGEPGGVRRRRRTGGTCRTPRGRSSTPSWPSAASVTLAPDESAVVHVISGVAETREAALALIDEVPRPALRRARVRDGLVPEPGDTAPPQYHRGGRPDLRPAGHVGHPRERSQARRSQHHRAQPARPVGALALRHLG